MLLHGLLWQWAPHSEAINGELSEMLQAGNLNVCLSPEGPTAAPSWWNVSNVIYVLPGNWQLPQGVVPHQRLGVFSAAAVWHIAVAMALVRLTPCGWVHTESLSCFHGCCVGRALVWLGTEADHSTGGSPGPPDFRETPPTVDAHCAYLCSKRLSSYSGSGRGNPRGLL